jgi:hypothetical protein
MYEIYPSGFVTRYNLGVVRPGYYYLWYYADTPGRHLDVFGIGNVYSNKIVIDVYTISVPKPVPPKPIRPDPKKECEKNPSCHWSDAYRQCLCTGILPEDPEKVKCEQSANCKWANGQCDCFMPHPDDQEKKQCENTPNCHWANGQCLCTGLEPSEPQPTPMPEPVINPEPENGARSNNVGAMPS